MAWVPSAADKDEEEEDMQALTELQTPDIPQPEDPDVVEAEYDVRFRQVLPSIYKYFFHPRNKSLTSLCNRSRT